MDQVSPNFKMYHVIGQPNLMGNWPNMHGLKALAPRIRNLASDPLHDNRFGRYGLLNVVPVLTFMILKVLISLTQAVAGIFSKFFFQVALHPP